MSRILSDVIKQSAFDQETDKVYIILLTITHPNLGSPIYITSDSVDTVSRGNTYIRFPFDLKLPTDEEDSLPRATLTIDNVDRQIVNSLRSLDTAATFLLEIIVSDDLDSVIVSFPDFKLSNVRGNALQVSGDLILEDIMSEPFPGEIFSPAKFPGLFV